ncbi:uncharacterized protein LOC129743364 [Uranotaenia lowii]|uniref:uncharacterized protein LOC129743364 n=1 Tax=Uranotaenia lowii TaxID=190385 RepID=UPI0024790F4B|nr:uncharacterized protein LOC129743364 [Uranotaenia lowii]
MDLKTQPRDKLSMPSDPKLERIFTLENISESELILNAHAVPSSRIFTSCTSVGQSLNGNQKGNGFPNTKHENPSKEVAEKLSQLKTQVANLIDQTIDQIQSEQKLATLSQSQSQMVESSSFKDGLPPQNGGGDGELYYQQPKEDQPMDHRAKNVQLLQSESFAQSKTELRKKLYSEIETVLERLKDLEKL